ncbi:MAG: hypothetical protein LBR86_05620, partial [Tannerella sp.]|nr:hypothetical protein [Tannerella sp.]
MKQTNSKFRTRMVSLFGAILLCAGVVLNPLQAATVTVNGYTGAAIQAAIDAAGDRGTVIFPGGTYLVSYVILVNHNVTLKAADGATVILKCTAANQTEFWKTNNPSPTASGAYKYMISVIHDNDAYISSYVPSTASFDDVKIIGINLVGIVGDANGVGGFNVCHGTIAYLEDCSVTDAFVGVVVNESHVTIKDIEIGGASWGGINVYNKDKGTSLTIEDYAYNGIHPSAIYCDGSA